MRIKRALKRLKNVHKREFLSNFFIAFLAIIIIFIILNQIPRVNNYQLQYNNINSGIVNDNNQTQNNATNINVYREDWTADEDIFMKGLAIPEEEKKYYRGNGNTELISPEASHFPTSPIPNIIRVLAILVEFQDVSHVKTKNEMESLVFGPTNSLNDYYNEVSYGKVTIVGNATDWLKLPHNMVYYGKDSASGKDDYYGSRTKIMSDAIDLADPYVDYNSYDKIIILHAGDDQAQSYNSDDLWSCALLPHYGPYWYRDGAPIYTASIEAETEGFGVICHEFGHQNNLPDLYDVVGSNHYCDNWALMAAGSWNGGGNSPAHLMGWSRLYLGLINESKIKIFENNQLGLVTLDDLETSGSNYSLIKIPLDDSHYYLVEARFKYGYDSALPDEGVLITYVDETRDTGYGIVVIQDSHSSTSDKNDGAYDHSAADEYGIFEDTINNIVIIVSEKGDGYYKIFVSRISSFQYSDQTVGGFQILYYNLGTLYPGQEIYWHWYYTSGLNHNLDCYITKDDSGDYDHVEDVDHDAGVYKVTSIGTYKLNIRNNINAYSTNIRSAIYTTSKPNIQFPSVIKTPSTTYRNQHFQIQATIKNQGGGTEDNLNVELILPAQVGFDSGESAVKIIYDLIYSESSSVNWNLVALDSGGPFTIQIKVTAVYSGVTIHNELISINIDTIKPTISIDAPSDNYITKKDFVIIEWSAMDYESGLAGFNIYINNSFYASQTALEEYKCNVTGLNSRIWNIIVEAEDFDGNKQNSTVKVIVDNKLPEILHFSAIDQFAASFIYFSFNVSISDNLSGIYYSKIYRKISSSDFKLLATKYEVSGNFEFTVLLDLIYSATAEFKLVVSDKAGNIIESNFISVPVDYTPPSIKDISITSDSEEAEVYSGMIVIRASVLDLGVGVDRVEIKYIFNGNTIIDEFQKVGLYYEYYINSNSYTSGTMEISIIAYDEVGNSKEFSQTINVNNQSSIISPEVLKYILSGVIIIAGICISAIIIYRRMDPIKLRQRYIDKKVKIGREYIFEEDQEKFDDYYNFSDEYL
ncbi:MAG: M6 family metalloprotease domain-containing protein [Promethearchaeota archaeon]